MFFKAGTSKSRDQFYTFDSKSVMINCSLENTVVEPIIIDLVIKAWNCSKCQNMCQNFGISLTGSDYYSYSSVENNY